MVTYVSADFPEHSRIKHNGLITEAFSSHSKTEIKIKYIGIPGYKSQMCKP